MDFNELLAAAKKTSDQRTKAHKELKKQSISIFKKYAEAMKQLGYNSSTFDSHLFADQYYYETDFIVKNYGLRFNFESLTFDEANGYDYHLCEVEYSNGVYSLDSIVANNEVNGDNLLTMLEQLPQRLKNCIEKETQKIEKIENFISDK